MASRFPRFLPDLGNALVSTAILEGGLPVAIMGREEPDSPHESGWTLLAGTETQAEVDDDDTYVRTTLNTIAFIDPDIVPFVTAAPGTLVTRSAPGAPLRVVEGPREPPDVVFQPPVAAGRLELGSDWLAESPGDFMRRIDHGDLVLFRNGLAIWIAVGTAPAPFDIDAELERVRQKRSPEATSEVVDATSTQTKLSYWLRRGDRLSLHGTCWAGPKTLRMAAVMDSDSDQADAIAFWDSLAPAQQAWSVFELL